MLFGGVGFVPIIVEPPPPKFVKTITYRPKQPDKPATIFPIVGMIFIGLLMALVTFTTKRPRETTTL
jgi:hypothetical protein